MNDCASSLCMHLKYFFMLMVCDKRLVALDNTACTAQAYNIPGNDEKAEQG